MTYHIEKLESLVKNFDLEDIKFELEEISKSYQHLGGAGLIFTNDIKVFKDNEKSLDPNIVIYTKNPMVYWLLKKLSPLAPWYSYAEAIKEYMNLKSNNELIFNYVMLHVLNDSLSESHSV